MCWSAGPRSPSPSRYPHKARWYYIVPLAAPSPLARQRRTGCSGASSTRSAPRQDSGLRTEAGDSRDVDSRERASIRGKNSDVMGGWGPGFARHWSNPSPPRSPLRCASPDRLGVMVPPLEGCVSWGRVLPASRRTRGGSSLFPSVCRGWGLLSPFPGLSPPPIVPSVPCLAHPRARLHPPLSLRPPAAAVAFVVVATKKKGRATVFSGLLYSPPPPE